MLCWILNGLIVNSKQNTAENCQGKNENQHSNEKWSASVEVKWFNLVYFRLELQLMATTYTDCPRHCRLIFCKLGHLCLVFSCRFWKQRFGSCFNLPWASHAPRRRRTVTESRELKKQNCNKIFMIIKTNVCVYSRTTIKLQLIFIDKFYAEEE